jgi:hypothetical protein
MQCECCPAHCLWAFLWAKLKQHGLFWVFLFVSTGGFALVKQECYHLSHASSPALVIFEIESCFLPRPAWDDRLMPPCPASCCCCWDEVLGIFLLRLAWNYDLPDLSLLVAEMTDMMGSWELFASASLEPWFFFILASWGRITGVSHCTHLCFGFESLAM